MLSEYGWNDFFENHYNNNGIELTVGRVVASYSEIYKVITPGGMVQARLSGRMNYTADDEQDLPVTGDWVYLIGEESDGEALVYGLLPRKSEVVRKRPGKEAAQVLASNLDYLCIVSAVDNTRNFSRIERYLSMAIQGNCEPVLLFNKTDLVDDIESLKQAVEEQFSRYRVFYLSALDNTGVGEFRNSLLPGKTYSFVGLSGVGKSSIINTFLDEAAQAVSSVRESDHRGRHTTTSRELVKIPGGVLVIDTPGLRETGIWCSDDSLNEVFDEISELAPRCRFTDCTHMVEPGCAVLEALETGELDRRQYENYLKLVKEAGVFKKKEKLKSISKEIKRFYANGDKYKD
ncbi:MAG: ribosome small subunit-dependent GTPase A [bacterium]|nr:ribosome small subunit-dependent GTPase A [bacterium]